MRRTKHRRRFHTERIVANRQRRMVREQISWWRENPLPGGRLEDVDRYHGCSRPKCHVCHWDKLVAGRRAGEKRAWHQEVAAQLEA